MFITAVVRPIAQRSPAHAISASGPYDCVRIGMAGWAAQYQPTPSRHPTANRGPSGTCAVSFASVLAAPRVVGGGQDS